jgi:hypothetical protein
MLIRRVLGVIGLLAALVATLAVLIGLYLHPYATPRTWFISELSAERSPVGPLLSAAFVVAGLAVAGFAVGSAFVLAPERRARTTAVAGAAAGLGVTGVGLVPLPHYDPHNSLAAFTILSCLLTTWLLARGGHALARAARWVACAQTALLVSAVLFAAVVAATGEPRYGFVFALERPTPLGALNPVAVSEWLFFACQLAVLVACAWRLLRVPVRAAGPAAHFPPAHAFAAPARHSRLGSLIEDACLRHPHARASIPSESPNRCQKRPHAGAARCVRGVAD